MRKIYQNLLMVLVIVTTLVSPALSQVRQKCGSQEWLEANFKAHPELRAEYEAKEKKMGQAISQRIAAGQSPSPFTSPVVIPIVFHVVLTATQQNAVTDAMIMAQLNVLNKDYSGFNADSANVPAAFQAVRGHGMVTFCLAQRKPDGTATNGIERVVSTVKSTSSSTNDPIKSTAAGGASVWDATKYVNVWLGNFTNAQLLGYGTFPIGSPEGGATASQQGVVVLAQSIPGGSASPYNGGRTLTHELGHYFWLRHPTGDTNCGNDFPNTPGIDDTPSQSDLTGGCPGQAPVITTQSTGCTGFPTPPGRMFQNFMDYTDDGCMTMFTIGQDTRMEMAINNYRASLLTSDGCQPPGPASSFAFNSVAPATVTCGGATSAAITLGTTASGGFNTPITLTATGNPAGTTVSFGTNPLTPGNSTTVTLNNTNTLTPGTYNVTVTGVAGSVTQTSTLAYTVSPGTPPSITSQPASINVCVGGNATFNVAATGTGLTYQWQVSTGGGPFLNITGATGTSYSITGVTSAHNTNQYHAIVTSLCGTSTSSAATLTVNPSTAITTQPAATVTICAGNDNTFSVSATGLGLSYQWQVSNTGCSGTFVDIIGATASTYTLTGITIGQNNFSYRVIVSSTGTCAPTSVTSGCSTLNVSSSVGINAQPSNVAACVGSNAVFTVVASGSGVNYQWQVSTGGPFTNIAGATSATLTVPSVTTAANGNQYQVVLTNATCTTPSVSASATLTVNTLPAIGSQPVSSTICAGDNVTFSSTATGTNIGYQWQVSTGGGPFTDIPGAIASTYTVNAATAAMNGDQYHVVVSGTCTPAATSNPATLTVISPVTISVQPVAPSPFCEGSDGVFTVTGNGGGGTLTYQWEVRPVGSGTWSPITGANSSTLTLTAVTAAMSGNLYRVILSNGTCPGSLTSSSVTLVVNALPVVTASADATSVCTGTAVTLTADGADNYTWTPGTGLSGASVTVNPTVNPSTPGVANPIVYTVVGTDLNNCSSSATVTVTANPLPVVTLTSTPANTALVPGQTVLLKASVTPSGNFSYTWDKNGVVLSNTTDSLRVGVNELGDYGVNVADPTGTCANNSNRITVKDSVTTKFYIYPNPNQGQFVIAYHNLGGIPVSRNVTVYDSHGARVYSNTVLVVQAYELIKVNLRPAVSGTYVVVLYDGAGKMLASERVVVRH